MPEIDGVDPVSKGIRINRVDPFTHGERGQLRPFADIQRADIKIRHAASDGQVSESRAAKNHTAAKGCDRVRNHKAGQRRAVSERLLFDGGDTVSEVHARKAGASEEGRVSNGPAREFHGFEGCHVLEGRRPDLRVPSEHDLFKSRPLEGAVHVLKGSREVDGGKVRETIVPVAEDIVGNARDALRQLQAAEFCAGANIEIKAIGGTQLRYTCTDGQAFESRASPDDGFATVFHRIRDHKPLQASAVRKGIAVDDVHAVPEADVTQADAALKGFVSNTAREHFCLFQTDTALKDTLAYFAAGDVDRLQMQTVAERMVSNLHFTGNRQVFDAREPEHGGTDLPQSGRKGERFQMRQVFREDLILNLCRPFSDDEGFQRIFVRKIIAPERIRTGPD